MAETQPRAAPVSGAEILESTPRTCTEEEPDGDRCSYEEQRDKRVQKLKEVMEPLVRASKNW